MYALTVFKIIGDRNWSNTHNFLHFIVSTILIWFILDSSTQIQSLVGARVAQWVRSLDLITHTSPSPIRRGLAPDFVNYKKGCTRLAAASNNVCQLLAHGLWFSPCTPASSTTRTGRHDIAEILLKVVLKHQKSNQSLVICVAFCRSLYVLLAIALSGFLRFMLLITPF